MSRYLLCLTLVLGAVTFGCVEQSKELTASEREQLKDYVLTKAPTPRHRLDARFENKITLLGYDVDQTSVRANEPVTVTWYWKVDRPLEEGWLLFTHVADGEGNNRLNQDAVGVVRRLYPPGRWKSGEFIKDEQRITLPGDWSSTRAVFYVGLWNGPHRLQVSSGPNDGENRVRGPSVTTAAAPGAAPPHPQQAALPLLRAAKATGTIRIDGQLDEPAWAQAGRTQRLVDTMNGSPADPNATARVAWDDNNLYVAFEVNDDFLKSTFRRRDEHVWEQDAVEIMVDPDGDGRNYFEMQVSPGNVVFDTRYDTRRQPQPFGQVDWNSRLRSAVALRGHINDAEADQGYTVEISIPWTAFNAGTPPAPKPTANTMWRMNLFVMDARQQGQRGVGWSPPRVGDFHTLDKFGRVVFFDPSAPAMAPPMPVPSQPGAPPTKIGLPPGALERLREQLRPGKQVRTIDPRNPRGVPGQPPPQTR